MEGLLCFCILGSLWLRWLEYFACFLPWVIVDAHKAKLWVRILKDLALREDLAINEGDEIAWAIRKNCPLLRHEIDEYVALHGKFTDDLVSEYLHAGKVVRNALVRGLYPRVF